MKKIRIILGISIVVLITLIISLFIYARTLNKNNGNADQITEPYTMEKSETEALEGKLYPNNFTEFYFKYKGKINTNEIYPKLFDVVVNYIPKFYVDLSKLNGKADVDKYYKNNQYVGSMGITSPNDLNSLATQLKKLKGSKLEYTISEVERQSTTVFSDRTEFRLKITYNEDQILKLRVAIYNRKQSNKEFIKIIPITEE